jgi:dTDP-4-amino-4,6-dideoxygalactose transaminase
MMKTATKKAPKLAINGGPKAKPTPYGTGMRFGLEELKELTEALQQNTLFYHYGTKVKAFLKEYADLYGAKYAVATTSGTASIHVGLGTAGVSVGHEVITGPITDAGTLVGILFQNAIPVFADLDPHTYNMDPRSIEKCVTKRTKAIVVVHLAGNPSDMDEIMAIARKHKLAVIEDCAQTPLAKYRDRYIGTIGDFGAFSTNDFKHISTGDGGVVLVNGDEETYKRAFMFADKNYNRFQADRRGFIPYLAPNYRMTELQGAVGLAQVRKLPAICAKHTKIGDSLTEGMKDLKGIHPHGVRKGNVCTYWFYMLRVDEGKLGATRDEFASALAAEGVSASAGYIGKCVYEYDMLLKREAYIGSHFPFDYGRDPKVPAYGPGLCPVAEEILRTSVRIGIGQFWTDDDIEQSVEAIRKVAQHIGKEGVPRKV